MRIKPYLQLCRFHSSPLETIPAIIGAGLATGSIFTIPVAQWGLFGLLYHSFGYSNNSLADWQKGYDTDDEHKMHHPLNSGKLTEFDAKIFNYSLGLVLLLYVIYLVSDSPIAAGVLIIGAINGFLYNYYGKKTQFKFIFISIAHTTVFIAPFIALGGSPSNIIFILSATYVFTWYVFEISISGEIKDITQDEENIVSRFITKIHSDGKIIYDIRLRVYGYSLKLITISTALLILYLTEQTLIQFALIPLLIALIYSTDQLLTDMFYAQDRRPARIRTISMIEIWTLLIFIIIHAHMFKTIAVVLLSLGSILWVVIGNKALWGSLIGPRV